MFRKKTTENYTAFMSGELLPLENVNDGVFSKKMMGDGFAIEPVDTQVVAPIDGKIVMVFPTHHAYGIKTKKGQELLIHLGLDTVELDGEGFESFVKVGDKIKQGDLIARMDVERVKELGKETISMLIFTSGGNIDILKAHRQVKANESDIIEVDK